MVVIRFVVRTWLRVWSEINRTTLFRRVIASGLCALLVLQVVQAFRYSRPQNDGTLARVQAVHVLRVGIDASYPPFGQIVDNQIIGLDADIARTIGMQQGWTIQLVQVGYDGLYDALYTSAVDVLISALPFDPARGTAFTRPYFDGGQYLVTRLDTAVPDSMAALEGQSVAVEYGSAGDETARIWERRLHLLTVQRYDSTRGALDAVRAGKADCALVDHVSALQARHEMGDVQIGLTSVTPETYHVVTRAASLDLAEVLNATLEEMASDGTLAQVIRRWLP